jgi:hypothetical protein
MNLARHGFGLHVRRALFASFALMSAMGVISIVLVCMNVLGTAPQQDQLLVRPGNLDFGQAWEDSRFQWILPIENTGAGEIEIEDLVPSCTCLSIEPRTLTIPALGKRNVALTLDLTARRSKAPETEWRDFEASILARIKKDTKNVPDIEWVVRGRVHTPIRVEPVVVDLGRQSAASQPLTPAKVVVNSYVPLNGLVAKSDAPLIQIETKASSSEGLAFELTVLPGALPIGPLEYRIVLTPVLRDDTRLPSKYLPLVGQILDDIQASPPQVILGAREVGDIVEETITIYSLTHQSLKVRGVTSEGEGLSGQVLESQPFAHPVISVKQRVAKEHEQRGKLIVTLLRNGKDTQVDIPVSYLGMTPHDSETARRNHQQLEEQNRVIK